MLSHITFSTLSISITVQTIIRTPITSQSISIVPFITYDTMGTSSFTGLTLGVAIDTLIIIYISTRLTFFNTSPFKFTESSFTLAITLRSLPKLSIHTQITSYSIITSLTRMYTFLAQREFLIRVINFKVSSLTGTIFSIVSIQSSASYTLSRPITSGTREQTLYQTLEITIVFIPIYAIST